jgi:hypothetical protein
MVSCRVTGAVSTNGAPRAPRIHFDKKRRAGLSIKSKLKNPDNPSRRATRLAASSISGRSVSRTTVADPENRAVRRALDSPPSGWRNI